MSKAIVVALSILVGGCALVAPDFDVPTDEYGIQRTKSIIARVRCELTELIRDDIERPFPGRIELDDNDYMFAASLYLDVTNKAGLTPTASFPDTVKYVFDVGAEVELSRQDSQTINIVFSLRKLKADLEYNKKNHPDLVECPKIDTHLSGDLGLRRRAETAMTTPNFVLTDEQSIGDGEFSGTITFISTLAITSLGPTWSFRNFRGPGQFANASRVYNDKLTYGFATGKNRRKPFGGLVVAQRLIGAQLQNDALSQLSGLRNLAR